MWLKKMIELTIAALLVVQQPQTEYIENSVQPIDYEDLAEEHVILEYNICTEPLSIYDIPMLCEAMQDTLEMEAKLETEFDIPACDYFAFQYDLNEDGLEDYIVQMSGILWGGGESCIEIYLQVEAGVLEQVLSVSGWLSVGDDGEDCPPVAVLDEKTDGYHAVVLPYCQNSVYAYSKESEWYVAVSKDGTDEEKYQYYYLPIDYEELSGSAYNYYRTADCFMREVEQLLSADSDADISTLEASIGDYYFSEAGLGEAFCEVVTEGRIRSCEIKSYSFRTVLEEFPEEIHGILEVPLSVEYSYVDENGISRSDMAGIVLVIQECHRGEEISWRIAEIWKNGKLYALDK